jgi:hypothetical protein
VVEGAGHDMAVDGGADLVAAVRRLSVSGKAEAVTA